MTVYPPLVEPVDLPGAGLDAAAVSAACATVRGYCGWHIAPVVEESDVVLDGPGGWLLLLPTLRLVDVSGVSSDGAALTAGSWSWSGNGVVETSGGLSSRRRGVAVTFTHGYDACPEDLLQVIAALARGEGRGRLVRETQGPFSAEFDSRDPVHATLDRYRLPVLA